MWLICPEEQVCAGHPLLALIIVPVVSAMEYQHEFQGDGLCVFHAPTILHAPPFLTIRTNTGCKRFDPAPLFACDGGVKINDVQVTNWQEPGDAWWNNVRSKSFEPLIETTVKFTLSYKEYMELLDKDEIRMAIAPSTGPND